MPIWHPGSVIINVLFVGIPVANFKAAVDWYAGLLGRPADIVVHESEVMWRLADAAWMYVLHDPDRAGHAIVTIAVADLDAAILDIESRGLVSPPIEIMPGAGRKASFADLEGNHIAFIEVDERGH